MASNAARVSDRSQEIQAFLTANGWGSAQQTALAGDASNRRYVRLQNPSGDRAVLMDASADAGMPLTRFIDIASYLISRGLSAPRIVADDVQQGLLLLEDLGATDIATYLPFNQLVYADRMSMARSLEVRVPFVDQELASRLAIGRFDGLVAGAGKMKGDHLANRRLVFDNENLTGGHLFRPLSQRGNLISQILQHGYGAGPFQPLFSGLFGDFLPEIGRSQRFCSDAVAPV